MNLLSILPGSAPANPTPVSSPGALNPAAGTIYITAPGAYTLPNDTIERDLVIKRTCAGAVTVSGNFDSASGTVRTLDSTHGWERLALRWSTSLSTYLVQGYYDPGIAYGDLGAATLTGAHLMAAVDPATSIAGKTTPTAIAAVIGAVPTAAGAAPAASVAFPSMNGTSYTVTQLAAAVATINGTATPAPTPTPSPTPSPTPTPTPPAGPANTVSISVNGGLPASPFSANQQFAGYNRGEPFHYWSLSNSGGTIANSTTGVLAGWGTSATIPPAAATLPPGFAQDANKANGYIACGPAPAAPFFTGANDYLFWIAEPTGHAAENWYFWVSTDNGATWSVLRDGSNVAIPLSVTFP